MKWFKQFQLRSQIGLSLGLVGCLFLASSALVHVGTERGNISFATLFIGLVFLINTYWGLRDKYKHSICPECGESKPNDTNIKNGKNCKECNAEE